MQLSSRLNDAFATLKEPLSRAAYLLELAGVSVDEVSQSDLGMDVLLEQMQLREAVAEAPEGEAGRTFPRCLQSGPLKVALLAENGGNLFSPKTITNKPVKIY